MNLILPRQGEEGTDVPRWGRMASHFVTERGASSPTRAIRRSSPWRGRIRSYATATRARRPAPIGRHATSFRLRARYVSSPICAPSSM